VMMMMNSVLVWRRSRVSRGTGQGCLGQRHPGFRCHGHRCLADIGVSYSGLTGESRQDLPKTSISLNKAGVDNNKTPVSLSR